MLSFMLPGYELPAFLSTFHADKVKIVKGFPTYETQ